ncbi:putative sporulation protein YtxC [Evansella clarkii]|uniref:putative sporulation protein YtxC n=1 Tax=Evansella clarkii TaxID=79879 RepID=UPI000997BED6|nr:putative sporulation protein YtxC [Evansella clarkii]
MLVIEFKNISLCEAFYCQLLRSMDTYEGVRKSIFTKQEDGETRLFINMNVLDGDKPDKMKEVALILTNVTIKNVLPLWMEELLRERFYYEEQYEIDAIMGHARDLFFNPPEDVPLETSFLDWQKEMFQLYHQFIQASICFSFESFLMFRFRKNKEQLGEIVEKAIDEYKMEYDYQIMLQTCREFLKDTVPRVDTVQLFLEEEVKLVDGNGRLISSQQILRWLSEEMYFDSHLPLARRVIGPLVSISPRRLIIHPRTHHEGLLHTLLSIFEERVELKKELAGNRGIDILAENN